jgi:competence protein ComFC
MRRYLLPNLCSVCLVVDPGKNELVCPECATQVRELPSDRCRLCGGAADGVLDICGECLELGEHPWTRAVSVFNYGGKVRNLIHHFKYHGGTHLTPWFAEKMAMNWIKHGDCSLLDVIAPVPLHPLKALIRGYNQAELLAQGVAKILNTPIIKPLRRQKFAKQQAMLDFSRRKANVKNIFTMQTNVSMKGRKVLLIDDVMTTGATLAAATKVLLQQHEAASVSILTLARG